MTLTADSQPDIVPDVAVISAIGGKRYQDYLPFLSAQQESMASQRCLAKSIIVCDSAIVGEVIEALRPMWEENPELREKTQIVGVPEFTTASACWNAGKKAAQEDEIPYLATIGADDMYPPPNSQGLGGLDLLRETLDRKHVDLVVARPKLLSENGKINLIDPSNDEFGPLARAGKIISADDVKRMQKDEFPWWLGAMVGNAHMLVWNPEHRIGEDLDSVLRLIVEFRGKVWVSGPEDPVTYHYRKNPRGLTAGTPDEKRSKTRNGIVGYWRSRVHDLTNKSRILADNGVDSTDGKSAFPVPEPRKGVTRQQRDPSAKKRLPPSPPSTDRASGVRKRNP